MSRDTNVIKWFVIGAIAGVIFAAANNNEQLLGSLRPYGLPNFGYFYSAIGGAFLGTFFGVLRNWWRRER